jgi:hypothetical protein
VDAHSERAARGLERPSAQHGCARIKLHSCLARCFKSDIAGCLEGSPGTSTESPRANSALSRSEESEAR